MTVEALERCKSRIKNELDNESIAEHYCNIRVYNICYNK